jgi:biotin carboxylase
MIGNNVIAIVDGYSAAADYVRLAKQLGFKVVHIQSTVEIADGYKKSFDPNQYLTHFIFDENDISQLLNELRLLNVRSVFAGIETGVVVADLISERMKLKSNGTSMSLARRDKYLMHQAVLKEGLRIPQQILADCAEDVVQWFDVNKFDKMVVKPVHSAGSDDVTIVSSPDQITSVVKKVLGKKNLLGYDNKLILAQEFIDGYEYAVNAVSLNGCPKFTHIWRYHKLIGPDGQFIYDYEVLLRGSEDTALVIYDYVSKVIRALGIVHGPTHTEIKIDERGPVIIESAARIDGISNIDFDNLIVKDSQLELSLKAWTKSIAPTETLANYIPYNSKQSASNVSLISNTSGLIKSTIGIECIKKLKSYKGHKLRVQEGQAVSKTVDIFTSPGTIFLAHANESQIKADLLSIREIELAGRLFELT